MKPKTTLASVLMLLLTMVLSARENVIEDLFTKVNSASTIADGEK